MAQDSTNGTLHKKAVRGKPRTGWKAAFLASLAETANVSASARIAGIGRTTVYARRAEDADFASEWDDASELAVDQAEAEMFRRAVHGVDKPIYQNGKQVGTIREFSDTLLIFLLKGRRSEVYGTKARHEISGPNGGPLPISFNEAADDIYAEPAPSEGDEPESSTDRW